MRYAIVSDMHANLQAWKAVEKDLAEVKPDQVICLGDVVGYGPNPVEVLERVYKRCDHFVMGNHDAAVCGQFDPADFNDEARAVILWTRAQLNESAIAVINEIPYMLVAEKFACSHAEFELPERFDYIFEPGEAAPSIAATQVPILFIGHTHVPCTMRVNPDGSVSHLRPAAFQCQPGHRYLVNVGSVGDPRDGTVNASYVLFNDQVGHVEFRSVPFDIPAYQAALAQSGLPTKPYLFEVLQKKRQEAIAARVRSISRRGGGEPVRLSSRQVVNIQRGGGKTIQIKRKSHAAFAASGRRSSGSGKKGLSKRAILLLALLAFCASFGAVWLATGGKNPPANRASGQAGGNVAPPATGKIPLTRAQVDGILDQVRAGKKKPADAQSELRRLMMVATRETLPLAEQGLKEVEKVVQQGVSNVLFDLRERVDKLVAAKDFAGADALLRGYTGPFAEETQARRLERANDLAPDLAAHAREKKALAFDRLDKVRQQVVRQLSELRMTEARAALAKLAEDAEAGALPECRELQEEFEDMAGLEKAVFRAFLEDKEAGLPPPTLLLEGEQRAVEILSLQGDRLMGRISTGGGRTRDIPISLSALGPKDLVGRLRHATDPQKVLAWIRAGRPEAAQKVQQDAARKSRLAQDLIDLATRNRN